MANGSAPGRSGWTGDLLRAIGDDPHCLEGITSLVTMILNGEVRGRAREVLLTSVLVGIGKPKGGVRPIAIGEVFYKLAALYALRTIRDDIPGALGAGQFALLPGGAEAASLSTRVGRS